MNDIMLRGLVPDTCVVFIDDTIVKGKSVEGFLFGLVEVLKRMRQFNVKLKASKCRFGYNSVEFVGHVFDKSGYSLSDKRKREIMDLPEPKDLKSLRRVLGLVNFFRDFIPNSRKSTDLTAVSQFQWNEEASEAFQNVKEAVQGWYAVWCRKRW